MGMLVSGARFGGGGAVDLVNPNFDTGSDGWQVFNGFWSSANQGVRIGSYDSSEDAIYYGGLLQNLTLPGPGTYEVTADVRSHPSAGFDLKAQVGNSPLRPFAPFSDLRQTVTCVASDVSNTPGGADNNRVYFSGTGFIDNVVVKKVS